MLVLALQKIKSFKDRFTKILGPELVQYYHRAYYWGEDISTNLGRFKVDILQLLDKLVIPTSRWCVWCFFYMVQVHAIDFLFYVYHVVPYVSCTEIWMYSCQIINCIIFECCCQDQFFANLIFRGVRGAGYGLVVRPKGRKANRGLSQGVRGYSVSEQRLVQAQTRVEWRIGQR